MELYKDKVKFKEIVEIPIECLGVANLYTNSILEEQGFNVWGSDTMYRKYQGAIQVNSLTNPKATSFGIMQQDPYRTMKIKKNRKYLLSFDYKGTVDRFDYLYLMRKTGGNKAIPDIIVPKNTGEWERVEVEVNTDIWDTEEGYILIGSRDNKDNNYFYFKNVMFIDITEGRPEYSPNLSLSDLGIYDYPSRDVGFLITKEKTYIPEIIESSEGNVLEIYKDITKITNIEEEI